jgi:alpha-tubulin suppressor-like RCC1 family protein
MLVIYNQIMTKPIKKILLKYTGLLLILFPFSLFSQIGIGTDIPESSAVLDVTSTTKGFLPPRLTTDQRSSINGGNIAAGLTVYNTDIKCIEFYTGTEWENLCGIQIPGLPSPPAGIETIQLGDATLKTTYCFDIAEGNNFVMGAGPLSMRQFQRANFNETTTNTKTLTFKSSTPVSNLSFYATDTSGKVISTFTPTTDYSNTNSLTEATAQIVYKSSLSSPDPTAPSSGTAHNLLRKNALGVTFYAVYMDQINGGGTQKRMQISPRIQDNECGNFVKRSLNTPYFFLSDDGESYSFGDNKANTHTVVAGFTTPSNVNGGFIDTLTKTNISTPLIGLSHGTSHTVFLDVLGRLYITSNNNAYGITTGGTGVPMLIPFTNTNRVDKVVANDDGTYFRTEDGSLYAFGNNVVNQDQLGFPSSGIHINLTAPEQLSIPSNLNVIDFDHNFQTSILLGDDGNVYTSGKASEIGRTGNHDEFLNVTLPINAGAIVDIACTQTTTIVLDINGRIYGWGQNSNLTLGSAGAKNTPVEIPKTAAMGNFIRIWTGTNAAFFLSDNNTLWAIGTSALNNTFGQLGVGSTGVINTLTQCILPPGVIPVDVITQDFNTKIRANDGKMYSAGLFSSNLVEHSLRANGVPGKPTNQFHEIETPAYLNNQTNGT